MLFNAPPTASWVIKKLCKVKETLVDWMTVQKYTISSVYKDLMGTQESTTWAYATWNRITIPRSRFIIWLACHDRLKTKDKLRDMGVIDDDTCPICGSHPESRDHLFFECEYSRQCVIAVRNWLGVPWSIRNIQDFHRKHRGSRIKRSIIEAVIGNLIYTIWRTRNEVVWHHKVETASRSFETIKSDSMVRIQKGKLNRSTVEWVRSL